MSYTALPDPLTVGTLLDTACACETKDDAARMLDDYRLENPEHADENLGYIFGYVEPPKRRAALYALFEGIQHPVFGGDAMASDKATPASPMDEIVKAQAEFNRAPEDLRKAVLLREFEEKHASPDTSGGDES